MATKKSGGQLDREIDEVLLARQKREAKAQPKAPRPDEYDSREQRTARGRLAEIDRAPLAERKEAQADFLTAMRDPELVAERIRWLLDGNYGHGEQLIAKGIIAAPRMNRSAALTHLIGAFEWQCPQAMAVAAWKKLSTGEKAKLEAAVQKVIKRASSGGEE